MPIVDVPDNSECIATVEAKPYGVLPLLDEQCRLGERGTDAALCELLNEKNAACVAAVAALGQKGRTTFRPDETFTIRHFVQPVTYTGVPSAAHMPVALVHVCGCCHEPRAATVSVLQSALSFGAAPTCPTRAPPPPVASSTPAPSLLDASARSHRVPRAQSRHLLRGPRPRRRHIEQHVRLWVAGRG